MGFSVPVRLEALEGPREGLVRLGRPHLGVDHELRGPLRVVARRRERRAQRPRGTRPSAAAGSVRPSAAACPPNSFVYRAATGATRS